MTNKMKMPEVGKRYLSKSTFGTFWAIPDAVHENMLRMCCEQMPHLDQRVYKHNFWEFFEELPTAVTLQYGFGDNPRTIKEWHNMQKDDKVQVAMEELRWQIDNDGWSDAKQSHERLLYFAKNLLNALEDEKCAVCNHEKFDRPLTATEFKNHAAHLGAKNFYDGKKQEEAEKKLINRHSVYTQCWQCGERSVPTPEVIECLNCNSINVSRYYAEEDLEFGLEQRKKDRELRKSSKIGNSVFTCKRECK